MASVRLRLMVALRSTAPGQGRPVSEHTHPQIIGVNTEDVGPEAPVSQVPAFKYLSQG